MRVDASAQIGTGHFMRCLALADALRARGARVRFVSRPLPAPLDALAVDHGHALTILPAPARRDAVDDLTHSHWLDTSQQVDAALTRDALVGERIDWLVIDHYALDVRWESSFRSSAAHILVIDDLADRTHDCDALLDQNLHDGAQARYATKVPAHCQLLLGPRFALLRSEIADLHAAMRGRDGIVRRLLIVMGGIDQANLTALAIEAATRVVRDLPVDVVVGAHNPSRERIADLCRRAGYALHVQPKNLGQLMETADLAIGAGGIAAWERCCAGLPALTLCGADNQREQLRQLALHGLAYAPDVAVGDVESLATHLRALLQNPDLLAAVSRNGRHWVDGNGAQRVASVLGCRAVEMRKATPADSARLLAWRNHPAVRAASGNSEPIPPAAHAEWFASVLADPDRHLLIGEMAGEPVGVVRFDVSEGAADVSIYLAPGREGRGQGSDLLQAAEAWLAATRPTVHALNARVLRDNDRSHRLFAACGYRRISTHYAKELAHQ